MGDLEDKVRDHPAISPAAKEIGMMFARTVDSMSAAYLENLEGVNRQYDALIRTLQSLRNTLNDLEERINKLENGF